MKRWQYRIEVCDRDGWFTQYIDSRFWAAVYVVWHRRWLGRMVRVNGEFWA